MFFRKQALRALFVIVGGLWMLGSAPATAAEAAMIGCNEEICVAGAGECDEAERHIVCGTFCPMYVRSSCDQNPGGGGCENDEYRFVCYDMPS